MLAGVGGAMRRALLGLLVACAAGEDPPPIEDTDPGDVCERFELTRRPWQDGTATATLGEVVGDVVIPTTAGEIRLSEAWTGCESWLFLLDEPRQNGDSPGHWEEGADVTELFEAIPRNAHLVFVSTASGRAERQQAVDRLARKVERAVSRRGGDAPAWWAERVHYVTAEPSSLPDWLGAGLADPGWGLVVDRLQQLRYMGSYADPERYSSSIGWFLPNLAMAANEVAYANHVSDREDALAADGATVLPIFEAQRVEDPGWSGARGYAELELPDAATMAGFDTLELDLTLDCIGDGEFGTCPAWDYLAWAWLCDADDPDHCEVEFGRWITTYHREGRWVHDASALLPLLSAGGTRRVAFYTQQPYAVSLSARLSDQGKAERPAEVLPLFSLRGEGLGAGSIERAPVEVTIPADAVRVELTHVITGHGGADPGNCAEFCTIEHRFDVGGEEVTVSYGEPGDPRGCQADVARGTVPNQYGTWWYGRNGWCPGQVVPPQSIDITSKVTKGQPLSVGMASWYEGAAYPGGGATTWAEVWLTVYR